MSSLLDKYIIKWGTKIDSGEPVYAKITQKIKQQPRGEDHKKIQAIYDRAHDFIVKELRETEASAETNVIEFRRAH